MGSRGHIVALQSPCENLPTVSAPSAPRLMGEVATWDWPWNVNCCGRKKPKFDEVTWQPLLDPLAPEPKASLDDLLGVWKVVAEEGSLDEYLSMIGVPRMFRKQVV